MKGTKYFRKTKNALVLATRRVAKRTRLVQSTLSGTKALRRCPKAFFLKSFSAFGHLRRALVPDIVRNNFV